MAANHQEIYTINASMQAICNTIRSQEFSDKLRTSLKSENPTPTGVWFRIHHGVSFTSWGEKITITLVPLTPNSTQVTIHSECGMPTQIIDWGKNKQVVCNIYEYIEAHVDRSPMQQPAAQPVTQPVSAQPTGSYCAMCGAFVNADANFCQGCGSRMK